MSEMAAMMTTAASAVCGRSASRPGTNRSMTTTSAGADQPGDLGLGAGLLGDGGARAAHRDREALEEAGGGVGRAHGDHLVVGVHLVAAPGGEARRRRDGVGQRDEDDAHAAAASVPRSAALVQGNEGTGKPWGSVADRLDALRGEVEHGRDDGRADDRDEHRRDLPREPRQAEQQREHAEADHQGGDVGLVEAGEERLDLLDEAVGVGGEAEELGELADEDGDGQPVHVADLDLLAQQVGDEPELAQAEADLDERRP